MKNNGILVALLSVIAALVLVAASALVMNTFAPRQTQVVAAGAPDAGNGAATQVDTLVVAGTGTAQVKPDVAYVTVGVTTEQTEAQQAQQENADKTTAVTQALKDQGVAEDDIQTSQYSLQPVYDYSNDARTLRGYQVSTQMTVTLRQPDQVGALMDKAVSAGANDGFSVSFGLLDEQAAYDEALQQAVTRAGQKAQTLAKSSGRALGAVLGVTENGAVANTGAERGAVNEAMMDKAAGATNIQSGSLTVTATVSVTYLLG